MVLAEEPAPAPAQQSSGRWFCWRWWRSSSRRVLGCARANEETWAWRRTAAGAWFRSPAGLANRG